MVWLCTLLALRCFRFGLADEDFLSKRENVSAQPSTESVIPVTTMMPLSEIKVVTTQSRSTSKATKLRRSLGIMTTSILPGPESGAQPSTVSAISDTRMPPSATTDATIPTTTAETIPTSTITQFDAFTTAQPFTVSAISDTRMPPSATTDATIPTTTVETIPMSTITQSDAFTTVMTTGGEQCVFPFKYKGVTYYECTTVNSIVGPWCATETTEDGSYKSWDECIWAQPSTVSAISDTRMPPSATTDAKISTTTAETIPTSTITQSEPFTTDSISEPAVTETHVAPGPVFYILDTYRGGVIEVSSDDSGSDVLEFKNVTNFLGGELNHMSRIYKNVDSAKNEFRIYTVKGGHILSKIEFPGKNEMSYTLRDSSKNNFTFDSQSSGLSSAIHVSGKVRFFSSDCSGAEITEIEISDGDDDDDDDEKFGSVKRIAGKGADDEEKGVSGYVEHEFGCPSGITWDPSDDDILYVGEFGTNKVKKIDLKIREVSEVEGFESGGFWSLSWPTCSKPIDILINEDRVMFVACQENNLIAVKRLDDFAITKVYTFKISDMKKVYPQDEASSSSSQGAPLRLYHENGSIYVYTNNGEVVSMKVERFLPDSENIYQWGFKRACTGKSFSLDSSKIDSGKFNRTTCESSCRDITLIYGQKNISVSDDVIKPYLGGVVRAAEFNKDDFQCTCFVDSVTLEESPKGKKECKIFKTDWTCSDEMCKYPPKKAAIYDMNFTCDRSKGYCTSGQDADEEVQKHCIKFILFKDEKERNESHRTCENYKNETPALSQQDDEKVKKDCCRVATGLSKCEDNDELVCNGYVECANDEKDCNLAESEWVEKWLLIGHLLFGVGFWVNFFVSLVSGFCAHCLPLYTWILKEASALLMYVCNGMLSWVMYTIVTHERDDSSSNPVSGRKKRMVPPSGFYLLGWHKGEKAHFLNPNLLTLTWPWSQRLIRWSYFFGGLGIFFPLITLSFWWKRVLSYAYCTYALSIFPFLGYLSLTSVFGILIYDSALEGKHFFRHTPYVATVLPYVTSLLSHKQGLLGKLWNQLRTITEEKKRKAGKSILKQDEQMREESLLWLDFFQSSWDIVEKEYEKWAYFFDAMLLRDFLENDYLVKTALTYKRGETSAAFLNAAHAVMSKIKS